MEDKKQISPEEYLESEKFDFHGYFVVTLSTAEDVCELERERTLSEAIDRINKETFGGMKENISTKKVIEILTKLKEGK